jgi:hypothetical protein
MAIASVQVRGDTGSGTSHTLPYTSNVTAGNLLVACVSWASSSTTPTAVTAGGVAMTAVSGTLAQNGTGGWSSQIYYLANAAAGATTVEVDFAASTTGILLDILEYSGADTATPLDLGNKATGTTSSVPAVSVTTTADHDLVVGHTLVAGSATSGAGFNSRLTTAGNSTEDLLDKTPAGAVTVQFSGTNSWWNAVTAAFKVAGAGGGASPTPSALVIPSVAVMRPSGWW